MYYVFINPFIIIRNKQRVLSSEDSIICPQRAVLPVHSGTTSRCRLKWSLGALFLNLNMLGRVWEPDADYNGFFAHFQLKKKNSPNGHYYMQAASPDQITHQNSLKRAVGP
jgi:hypothetical protein